MEKSYKADQGEGVWRGWYSNGKLVFEGNYRSHKKDGVWKVWYADGQLGFEGAYKSGKPDGAWKEWDKNGLLRRNDSCKMDVHLTGWKKWDEVGKPVASVLYRSSDNSDEKTKKQTQSANRNEAWDWWLKNGDVVLDYWYELPKK